MLVGNDLVDLAEPGVADKVHDARFLHRVLRAEERALLAASAEPSLTLAALWSAKEAAYKIAAKVTPGALFAHRTFAVIAPAGAPPPTHGVVRSGGLQVRVTWAYTPSYVHCVAELGDPGTQGVHWSVGIVGSPGGEALSRAELASCHGAGSVATRLLAKELLAARGYPEARVLRAPGVPGGRLAPPRAYGTHGPLRGVDVSLSDDGRYAAAAVCAPRRLRGGPSPARAASATDPPW